MFSVKEVGNAREFDAILSLRYNALRKPWNQPIDTATDQLEQSSINAFISDENEIAIACGRLQENENKIGQIRFMAVAADYRGRGLGKQIISYLEQKAKDLNLTHLQLQARENAVQFYLSCGYEVKEKSFLLWGQIQHFLMEKKM